MIKALANKKIELSKEENDYMEELKAVFGEDSFRGLFESDKGGYITAITPSPEQPVAMVLIFFLLNLMINQRLRRIESRIDKISEIDDRLKKIEERMD